MQCVPFTSQHYERHCTTGGPRSRTRTQVIRSSLLAAHGRHGDMPLVTHAAIDFGAEDPLEVVNELLNESGLDNPELLRHEFWVPEERCICRPFESSNPVRVATAKPEQVLATALLLSLCTPTVFDPARPVLLTRTSLTRHLELFSGRGFYA